MCKLVFPNRLKELASALALLHCKDAAGGRQRGAEVGVPSGRDPCSCVLCATVLGCRMGMVPGPDEANILQ